MKIRRNKKWRNQIETDIPKGIIKNLGSTNGGPYPKVTLPLRKEEIKKEVRKIQYCLKEVGKYFEKKEEELR
jgi:hypothetical protein